MMGTNPWRTSRSSGKTKQIKKVKEDEKREKKNEVSVNGFRSKIPSLKRNLL